MCVVFGWEFNQLSPEPCSLLLMLALTYENLLGISMPFWTHIGHISDALKEIQAVKPCKDYRTSL